MVEKVNKSPDREDLIGKFHDLVLQLRLISHQQRGVQASPGEKRYHDGVADGLTWAADMLVEFKNKKVRNNKQKK